MSASKFSDAQKIDFCHSVFSHMRQGLSLTESCKLIEIPRETVEDWIDKHSLSTEYARARECRADHTFDGMDVIEKKILSGEIDASAGAAVLRNQQWRLAKMYSKKYGDKLELSGDAENPLKIEKIQRVIVDK